MKSLVKKSSAPINITLLEEFRQLGIHPIFPSETNPKNYFDISKVDLTDLFTDPIFIGSEISFAGVIFDPSSPDINSWFFRGPDYYSVSGTINTPAWKIIRKDERFQNIDFNYPRKCSEGIIPISFKIYSFKKLKAIIPIMEHDFHF